MKKGKYRVRSIAFNVPLYGFDVCIIVGARTRDDVKEQLEMQRVNEKGINAFMSAPCMDDMLKWQAGSYSPDNELRLIYLFRDWIDDHEHRKTLVHEVSHMVDDIAEHKNLVKETEARAYLSDYLYGTIWENLTAKKGRISKHARRREGKKVRGSGKGRSGGRGIALPG